MFSCLLGIITISLMGTAVVVQQTWLHRNNFAFCKRARRAARDSRRLLTAGVAVRSRTNRVPRRVSIVPDSSFGLPSAPPPTPLQPSRPPPSLDSAQTSADSHATGPQSQDNLPTARMTLSSDAGDSHPSARSSVSVAPEGAAAVRHRHGSARDSGSSLTPTSVAWGPAPMRLDGSAVTLLTPSAISGAPSLSINLIEPGPIHPSSSQNARSTASSVSAGRSQLVLASRLPVVGASPPSSPSVSALSSVLDSPALQPLDAATAGTMAAVGSLPPLSRRNIRRPSVLTPIGTPSTPALSMTADIVMAHPVLAPASPLTPLSLSPRTMPATRGALPPLALSPRRYAAAMMSGAPTTAVVVPRPSTPPPAAAGDDFSSVPGSVPADELGERDLPQMP
jgi:hypothetical protein